MVIVQDGPFTEPGYSDIFSDFTNFQLSDFQKWAFKAIIDGDNALVTAPTGSGKTLPAEFMIHHVNTQTRPSSKCKIIYASPIKALSNQKLHDMRKRFPNVSFGLLTGDCKDNPEADVLIMTTEILRNTLFNSKLRDTTSTHGTVSLSFDINVDTELAGVIFDEVHYIADPERGSVWEQALLMIPSHVPLLLLSATIHKPLKFAEWIEQRHGPATNIKTYLLPSAKRAVPLTHYMWAGANSSSLQKIRDTELRNLAHNTCNTLALVKDSNDNYDEKSYHKVKRICDFLYDNYMSPKRQQVLNSLIRYLKKNNLLPALCFIFSRRQVELAAKDITVSLHDDGGIMSNTVEQECRKILMSKLPNYKEYLDLAEYKNMVSLLQKGVAIHHAGVLSILREMVEILFDRGFIKLLFATETFAVGINMPTKTVIFTSLEKYDGSCMRYLLPHEYSQMAGRAGRRGIDTIGTVVHCNTLFQQPTPSEYRQILTGPSQTITSKFRISYNLILNILLPSNMHKESIIKFVSNSLLNTDIESEIVQLDGKTDKLKNALSEREAIIQNLKTPTQVAADYVVLQENLKLAINKTRKRIKRDMDNLEAKHPFLLEELASFSGADQLRQDIQFTEKYKNSALSYISRSIDDITGFLTQIGLLRENPDKTIIVRIPGIIASQIQEVNALGVSLMLTSTEMFRELIPCEIAALLVCLVPLNILDDKRLLRPNSEGEILNATTIELQCILNKLQDLESRLNIDSGEDYSLQFDLQQPIIDWFISRNEDQCKDVLSSVNQKGISTGDFVKAILKICNTVREIEGACEILGYELLLEKLAVIPEQLLKYVVTNQSLYV